MSLEVRVKVEPLEDAEVSPADVWKDNDTLCDTSSPQAEESDDTICVKERVDLSEALSSLYANHTVKDELVLGPEQVQSNDDRQKLVHLNQALTKKADLLPALRDCFVCLERIPQKTLISNTSTTAAQTWAASHAGATGGRHTGDSGATGKRRTIDTDMTIIYMCDSCGKTFQRKNNLIQHIQLHLNKENSDSKYMTFKHHMCEVCGKLFTQIGHLFRHIRTHKGEKYACNICKKEYTRYNNLREHNCDRNRQKPYSCEICNKHFTRKMVLKKHKLIHTGEKPYTCEICNKKFTSSTNIKRHTLTHTGVMPYCCDICNKKFTRLSNLNEHILVHSGKKYRCTICKRQLSRLRTLNSHVKKYHN
ncbi:zinc finger protein 2-like [Cydia fagiglandana]|uniref:zinc finger protein 2-like n=1 Tax=Cydia fagiglandana TaxID=1458189 RepID=UPI002FEE63F8